MKAKSIIAIVLAVILVLSLAACAKKKNDDSKKSPEDAAIDVSQEADMGIGGGVEMVNPVTIHNSMSEAAAAAGFDFTVPESIKDISKQTITTISNKIIEVTYGDNSFILRKGTGGDADISGDYNEYEKTEELKVGETNVTIKGDGTSVMLALWQNGEYSYSFSAENGISTAELSDILLQLK